MANDYWGQDIALSESGQAKIAANGELVLTGGVETGVQDILLRLFTRLGTLFYDSEFGSLISDWFYEESDRQSRASFLTEVARRVEEDPRVQPGSVKPKLLKWDEQSIHVEVFWRFTDSDTPYNLVLQYEKSVKELVISGVKFNAPEDGLNWA